MYKGISLKVSVANIPWLTGSFVGFIAGLWLEDRLIEFTTYNSTKMLETKVNEVTVRISLHNKNYQLDIIAHRSEATELASPILGFMDGRISESMTSNIDIKLIDIKNNKLIFEDSGRNVALEVAGEIDEITIE